MFDVQCSMFTSFLPSVFSSYPWPLCPPWFVLPSLLLPMKKAPKRELDIHCRLCIMLLEEFQ